VDLVVEGVEFLIGCHQGRVFPRVCILATLTDPLTQRSQALSVTRSVSQNFIQQEDTKTEKLSPTTKYTLLLG